ncbi:MAG: hypothetical protein K5839_08270 [Treponemataceae bacterium]|nr:hypothetical protein [Treponemataceae bacterium]
MKKTILWAGAISIALCTLVSCASVPKEIPTDVSVDELKQKAYEFSAKGNYKAAEKYYETIIARFGMNSQILVASEFEIAHMYVKQKKYKTAEPMLNKILTYYEADTGLPGQYKKLAQLDLEKIQKHKNKLALKEAKKAEKKAKKAEKQK